MDALTSLRNAVSDNFQFISFYYLGPHMIPLKALHRWKLPPEKQKGTREALARTNTLTLEIL